MVGYDWNEGVYNPKNLGNDKTCSQASSKRFSVYNPKILGNDKMMVNRLILWDGVYNYKNFRHRQVSYISTQNVERCL